MILCKINIEENSQCKKCCKHCNKKCNIQCILDKRNIDCTDKIVLNK